MIILSLVGKSLKEGLRKSIEMFTLYHSDSCLANAFGSNSPDFPLKWNLHRLRGRFKLSDTMQLSRCMRAVPTQVGV